MKHKKSSINKKDTLIFIITFIIAFSVFYLISSIVGSFTLVSGSSMEPTYSNGQLLWVNKLNDEYVRFDVITFHPKGNTEKTYIKRIIGLPGETVKIEEDGTILINDTPLYETYGKETIYEEMRGIGETGITLKSNEYFCMGDNRNDSLDSRFASVGPVNKDQIIGLIKREK